MIVQRTQKGHKPQKGVKMLKTIHIQAQSGVASYYVNSEHITHFYGEAEGGKSYLVIYFVGGAYLRLSGYGDSASLSAFEDFIKDDKTQEIELGL